MSSQQMASRAVKAAAGIARELHIGPVEPEMLHISQHISIRLHPLELVARMLTAQDAHAQASLSRELVRKEAPVFAPATTPPPGPHSCGGFILTLWQHVEHAPADQDNRAHMARRAAPTR
jgi:hypothetical protein